MTPGAPYAPSGGAAFACNRSFPPPFRIRMPPLPPVWVALALMIAPVRTPLVLPPPDGSMSVARADTAVADAALALAHGRPWQASLLIAEVLADSARRTPD